jgi:hypothetical protein
MPSVTTTYNVTLLNKDASTAGQGTLSFTQPDENGNTTVSFISAAHGIPTVTGAKGTVTRCGGFATLQAAAVTPVAFGIQASIYAVGAGKLSTSGLGGGLAVTTLTAPIQQFAGVVIGQAQAAESGAE